MYDFVCITANHCLWHLEIRYDHVLFLFFVSFADGTMKTMVVSTYAMGMCELAKALGNPAYIEMWCLSP